MEIFHASHHKIAPCIIREALTTDLSLQIKNVVGNTNLYIS